MPLEMAAPERQEPPLAKLHNSAPVAPLRAYMCPAASSEQPYTTPLAVVTGPEAPPPCEGLRCQSISPVAALIALHTPAVVVPPPPKRGQGTRLLLALAG